MPSRAIKSLGYDPGLIGGYGVIAREGQRLHFVEAGTIETFPEWPPAERLRYIFATLGEIVREHNPQVIGYENQLGIAARARADMVRKAKAAMRGEYVEAIGYNASNDGVLGAQFMLMAVAFAYGGRLQELEPRTIKASIGAANGGNANKHEVKAAVRRVLQLDESVRLSSHGADGLATAITAERRDHIENRRIA